MEKFFTKQKNVLLMALVCMFLWGSAFPSIKIGYELLNIQKDDIFSKLYFASLRFILAGLMVFILHRLIYRKKLDINRENFPYILSLGLIQTSIQYSFFYIGLANTSGIKSSILQSGSTFITVIAAHFLYEEDRLNSRRVLSLLLGFLGIVLVNISSDFDLNFSFLGEGFLIIAAILSTLATLYAKKMATRNISAFASSGGQMFFGGLVLFAISKLGLGSKGLDFDLKSFGLLVYSAFISATAFTLWYSLLKYNSPGKLSIYKLFIPIFGAILSVLTLEGESFSLNIFLGLALVVLGIIVLNLDQRKAKLNKK